MQKQRSRVVRDVLYGYVKLSALANIIVDTPEFQALRNLRQLGVCHYVFPSANHTRFEHSIGTYHLAGVYLSFLPPMPPEISELVKIAALCHDLGHTAFSHTFDHEIAPKINADPHETRSARLFALLPHNLPSNHVKLVQNLILGIPIAGCPRWWFEIVANSAFEFDVDKADYLSRDAYYIGLPSSLQIERIFSFARVIDDHICFHEKVYLQLYDVFVTRFRMHKEVYRHPVVLSIEIMVTQMMTELAEKHNWREMFAHPTAWRSLHDAKVLDMASDDPELRHLVRKLHTRDLFKRGGQTQVSAVLGFTSSSSKPNPMATLHFYSDQEPDRGVQIAPEKYSVMLPAHSFEIAHLSFQT